jgi:hypothetical protein
LEKEKKMSSKRFALMALLLVLGVATMGFAQQRTDSHAINFSIPNIYVIDVDNNGGSAAPGTTVAITLSDPSDPGAQPTVAYTNNDNFLNYTSVVTATSKHKIEAKLDQLLPGVNIRLTATAPSGGYGSLGTSAATNLQLSTTDQKVMQAIGSCWTGTNGTSGAALVYDITFDDANFDDLITASPVRNVTFTIADE